MRLVSFYMFHGMQRHIFLLDDKLAIQADTTHRLFLPHCYVLFWKSGLKMLFTLWFQICYVRFMTIPVAAWSKTWVCGGSLAGIVGSNHAGSTVISFLWVWVLSVVRYRSLRRTDPSYRGVILCVCVCVCVCVVIRCSINSLHLQWVGRSGQTKKNFHFIMRQNDA